MKSNYMELHLLMEAIVMKVLIENQFATGE